MGDKREQYGYCLQYSARAPKGEWLIYDRTKRYDKSLPENDQMLGEVVVRLADDPSWEGDGPPPHVRTEYERLIEFDPQAQGEPPFNIVEMMAAGEEGGGFNQPCRYGNLAPGHAVYCHNTTWLYAPRKCRRTWYTGGERRDEDCEGYAPNPLYRKDQ